MKSIKTIVKERGAGFLQHVGIDGGFTQLCIPGSKGKAAVIFSWGEGWDHVSVSYSNRCPTWDEMCYIKNIFFKEDECVIQYHPPKSDYVNIHPYCLHLWRPQNQSIPMPPKEFV
jgi:hypothetical protein